MGESLGAGGSYFVVWWSGSSLLSFISGNGITFINFGKGVSRLGFFAMKTGFYGELNAKEGVEVKMRSFYVPGAGKINKIKSYNIANETIHNVSSEE
jgi:hypothetical protein